MLGDVCGYTMHFTSTLPYFFGQKTMKNVLENENSCVKALHLNLDYSGKLNGSNIIHIIFTPCINTLQKILDGYTKYTLLMKTTILLITI